ncbi:hypothetical protein JNW87_37605 [Micromonospora sp. ATA51]|nr:hypothetical protein [Micromonospora sp. ATA51]MBM0230270.1 hypothetical protein [Micromonospora sp. ATA51]
MANWSYSTACDQPSNTAWWKVIASTCSSAASRYSSACHTGPVARSNRVAAPACNQARNSVSRSAGSMPDRSTTLNGTSPGGSQITCGAPATRVIRQRSTSCRWTTARSAARNAVRSSGPRSRSAMAVL